LVQIKTHLVTKYTARPRSRAVFFVHTVGEHVAHEVFILSRMGGAWVHGIKNVRLDFDDAYFKGFEGSVRLLSLHADHPSGVQCVRGVQTVFNAPHHAQGLWVFVVGEGIDLQGADTMLC